MKMNNSIIVLATKPRMVAETQHPEHPELVGSWLDLGARKDNEIIVISNEVQVSKNIT